MKPGALPSLAVLVGCTASTPDIDPPWQLDQDRVIAVRAEPPAILPGEVARLEALIAHAGAAVSAEQPTGATAAFAPGDLFTAVHYNLDHWEVEGPDEARLAAARDELGLPAGAPVPLEISLQFAGPLYAKKRVLLGASHRNPVVPEVGIPGAIPAGSVVPLVIEVPGPVRWLASCGELRDHDAPRAELIAGDPCAGELVIVVRDTLGGIAWHVVPLHVTR